MAVSVRDWILANVLNRLHVIERKLDKMGAREDAAFARQEELIRVVAEGYRAKDIEIAALKEALANADATAQARVDEALAADSEFDAEKVEHGNAALEELVNPSPEPTPESEPTEPTE